VTTAPACRRCPAQASKELCEGVGAGLDMQSEAPTVVTSQTAVRWETYLQSCAGRWQHKYLVFPPRLSCSTAPKSTCNFRMSHGHAMVNAASPAERLLDVCLIATLPARQSTGLCTQTCLICVDAVAPVDRRPTDAAIVVLPDRRECVDAGWIVHERPCMLSSYRCVGYALHGCLLKFAVWAFAVDHGSTHSPSMSENTTCLHQHMALGQSPPTSTKV